jgi:hypothetical protein
MSVLGRRLNNLVTYAKRITDSPTDQDLRLYLVHLSNWFRSTSFNLGTKAGDISNYGMSVRYPSSFRGVATLSNMLPKNTIEIHRDVAKQLKVNSGDIVLVERFPCLGFVSLRPQKVRITDDSMCRYTIRVSGNSLVSQNLDFDGDTLYLASFHTPAAKLDLIKEWTNPKKTCYDEIKRLNESKGKPHTKPFTLSEFCIKPFVDLTKSRHAEIVEKNTGVKAQTGSTIAMTYDIMRLVENSALNADLKTKVDVEMFLERTAQSIFEQKHGGQSLCTIVRDGICTGDVEKLVDAGFKRGITEKICSMIANKAASINIRNLSSYHARVLNEGGSFVTSRLIQAQNKIYFASRASLDSIQLLNLLNAPAVDIPSKMLKHTIA